MNSISLISVFLASLLGSAHCAGMCGGFIAYYSAKANNSSTSHIAYHIGRLLTYTILGVLAGLLGHQIDNQANLFGFQKATALVTGIILIYWGISGVIKNNNPIYSTQAKNPILKSVSSLFAKI